MGKKKHKHGKQDRPGGAAMPLAGLFAAAASPAGKQVIAGVLRKAADALDHRAPAPPRAPDTPVPAPVADDVPPPPRGEVPPEVAKVIGSIAAGLERWAAKR